MAAATLSALRSSLAERGYHYLLGAPMDEFLNLAIEDTATEDDWPFMEATAAVTPPAEISDLDAILSVHDQLTGIALEPIEAWKVRLSPISVDMASLPRGFWLERGQTLNTQPSSPVSVRYLRAPTKLVGAGDVSDIPGRWTDVVLARAEYFAAQHSKNLAVADAADQAYQRGIERMRDRLIDPQRVAGRVMFRYVGEFA